MDVCEFLSYAVKSLELVAPATPNKYDDFALLGLKLAQSRLCEGEELIGSEVTDNPEVAKRAEAFADILEAAYNCKCINDCDC